MTLNASTASPQTALKRLGRLTAKIMDVQFVVVSLVAGGYHWLEVAPVVEESFLERLENFLSSLEVKKEILVVEGLANSSTADTTQAVIQFSACAPIIAPNGEFLGVLAVMDTKPQVFTPVKRLALEQSALLMAAALELAGQIPAHLSLGMEITLEQRFDALLHDVALNLFHQSDVDGLLRTILDRAAELVGTQNAYLYLKTDDSNELEVKFGIGVFQSRIGNRLKRGEGLGGQVWERQKTILVNDYDTWSGRIENYPKGEIHAIAGVPLRDSTQIVGVIGLALVKQNQRLTGAELEALERFADLASIALENARLLESIRSSEGRLRRVVESDVLGVMVSDETGLIVEANDALLTLLGYARNELEGCLNFRDLTPVEYQAQDERAIAELISSGVCVPYEKAYLHRNGHQVPVLISAKTMDKGVLVLVFDIGVRKVAEGRLHLLESVVVHSTDAVLITNAVLDENGPSILFANDAFVRMAGRSLEELVGQTPRLFQGVKTDRITLDRIRVSLEQSESVTAELLNYTKDGFEYWTELSISPVADKDGVVRHFISIQRDISARKCAELLEVDRNRVLELIARGETLEVTIPEIAALIERQHSGYACGIMLLWNGKQNHLAAPNLTPAFCRALEQISNELSFRDDKSSYLSVVITEDTEQIIGSELQTLNLEHGWRSNVIVPIIGQNRQFLGTMTVYQRNVWKPRNAEINLFEMVSRLVCVAVEQQQLTHTLHHQAHHDVLTGLPNRMACLEHLEDLMISTQGSDQKVPLLFLDLDNFKAVNDSFGHHVGDLLLQQIAFRLSQSLNTLGFLARFGGDEFVIVMNPVTQPEVASQLASQLLTDLRATPCIIESYEFNVAASIGIAWAPDHGQDVMTLQKSADLAMYSVKTSGKGGLLAFGAEANKLRQERLALENDLQLALERDEFELYYQPQVTHEGRMSGVEALLRWNRPNYAQVLPEQFISISEDTGSIVPIGDWVLIQVCRQAIKWQHVGNNAIRVAVNISPMQFVRADFVARVAEILKETCLEPALLELQLTESMFLKNDIKAIEQLIRLRVLGVKISIDDFGTGYSSFGHLHRLPVDTLKIHRSFIEGIKQDASAGLSALAPIEATMTLARRLNLSIIAEGIENEFQLEILKSLGCTRFQGYFFGRPLSVNEFDQQILSGKLQFV